VAKEVITNHHFILCAIINKWIVKYLTAVFVMMLELQMDLIVYVNRTMTKPQGLMQII